MVVFMNDEEIFNAYDNTPSDWQDRAYRPRVKSEEEMYTDFLRPSTQTSLRLMKGVDESNREKTGYGYSGFDETNTSDLTTANLKDDIRVGAKYINHCNMLLSDLETLFVVHGIDTRPSHRLILNQRAQYTSLSKGINGKLLEALTVRTIKTYNRQEDFHKHQSEQNKESFFNKVFGGQPRNVDPPNYPRV